MGFDTFLNCFQLRIPHGARKKTCSSTLASSSQSQALPSLPPDSDESGDDYIPQSQATQSQATQSQATQSQVTQSQVTPPQVSESQAAEATYIARPITAGQRRSRRSDSAESDLTQRLMEQVTESQTLQHRMSDMMDMVTQRLTNPRAAFGNFINSSLPEIDEMYWDEYQADAIALLQKYK